MFKNHDQMEGIKTMEDNKVLLLMFTVFVCGACALFYNYSQVAIAHLATKNHPQIISVGQPGDVWMVNDEGNLAPLGVDLTGQGRGEVTHWSLKHGLMVLGDATVFLQTEPGETDWKLKDRLELMYDGRAWREISRTLYMEN